jgi:hypothetical protein
MISGASDNEFLCPVCGETHALSYRFSPDVKAPVAILAVPEDERTERIVLSLDQCVIDNTSFFLRGRIPIPVHGREEPFIWGVWAEVSPKNFLRAHELWHVPGRESTPPFAGYLNNEIPLYGNTIDLEVDVQTQVVGRRPSFFVRDATHPIATEQRDGISLERVGEINVAMIHPTNMNEALKADED